MTFEFFGRQRECRFYTAGCGNKMAVSVTGPRAVNELGGPVIPGTTEHELLNKYKNYQINIALLRIIIHINHIAYKFQN